jgi:hypothetical protein
MRRDDEVTRALLWLGIEDYAGLWEAVWELNTQRPHVPESENRRIAAQALRELLDAGQITLFRSREPYEDVRPIPTDEAEAVLASAESWVEPAPGATSIRFSATESGEAAYNDMTRSDPI